MSFQPQFHVPGTFTFEGASTRSGQPLSAGIFRPPAHSPPESTYGSLYSDVSMSNPPAMSTTAKRKRISSRGSRPAGWGRNMELDPVHDDRNQHRYTLAGQIDATPLSPAPGAENGLLEESVYSDVDYRKRLALTNEPESPSDQPYDAGNADEPYQPASTAGWSIFNPLRPIGEMVGKVWEFCKTGAFRGFHAGGGNGYTFNGTTVTETKPTIDGQSQMQAWCNENNIPTLPSEDPPINNALLDSFQQQQISSPFASDYQDDYDSPDSTPQPAAKRRQVSANRDELRNWVVVDEQPEQTQGPSNTNTFSAGLKAATTSSRPRAPIRARSTFYASSGRRISAPSSRFTGGVPRPRSSLRISHDGSPDVVNRSFTPTPKEPASFASPRQSTTAAPVHHDTPSRIPVPIHSYGSSNPFMAGAQPMLASPTSPTPGFSGSGASRPSSRQSPRRPSSSISSRPISPTKTNGSSLHRRNQSGASARRHSLLSSSGVLVDHEMASPRLSAEAKQLAQRKLAVEKETDAKVDAFNARLMAMIRQGREALGTKVEVEMDDADDFGVGGGAGTLTGWEEDDDDSYL
ncbi:hypothetical protein QBC38DRAFT_221174 [Podospora fimiseda]|uniref:Uncharacterized protein n=1 Tax=Podospora fimiseda TaxID=252190 RepID=A0AAN7BNF9_9PEZI|nr:hypothetical protein QBC38DRAFT_221174 [Podospora fimiseda]